MIIRKYEEKDIHQMIDIWNEVVEDGIAFPQEDVLDNISGKEFFESQSYTGVAEDNGQIVGLYILHPNNVGRCGHICNASYAVSSKCRGQHIGEKLVKDCLLKAKEHRFRVLQFNAVVESNVHARHLYYSQEIKTMAREIITLACTECGRRNYTTKKDRKKTTGRLERSKYCPFDRKHTLHRETRS